MACCGATVPGSKYPSMEKKTTMTSNLSTPSDSYDNMGNFIYKVYKERWLHLITVCLLCLSNATQWITYISLSKSTARFYCGIEDSSRSGECSAAIWTNQIFQIMGILLGILGMYATDLWGIKISTRIGTTTNFLGTAIRLVSSLPDTPMEYRMIILHIGNVIMGSSQSFFLVLAPKIAQFWFPSHERATAHVMSFISNPLGIALGTIVPTIMINQSHVTKDSYDFFILNSVFLFLAGFVLILSLTTKRSSPPTPPSASCTIETEHPPFFKGILICLRNKQFLIQMIPFGISFGLLFSLFLYTDQLCTELGYPESVTAYASATASIMGGFSSIVLARYIDMTKKLKEAIRYCALIFAICALVTDCFLRQIVPSDSTRLYTAIFIGLSAALGMVSIPAYPIGIELAIETTFPTMEGSSGGCIITSGHIIMFIIVFLMDGLRSFRFIYTDYDSLSSIPRLSSNYFLMLDVWVIIAFISVFVAFKWMNPRYCRIEYENSVNLQKRLETSSNAGTPVSKV